MKITVTIRTTKEVSYNKTESIYLNPNDTDKMDQSIDLQLTGFNYKGSLKPLSDVIATWLTDKFTEGVKQSIKIKER